MTTNAYAVMLLAGTILFASTAVGAAPRGAIEIPEGGYLYLEHDDVFADTTDGLTVEGRFYFTAMPEEPRGDPPITQWPLIMKEGSYKILLTSRELRDVPGLVPDPPGMVMVKIGHEIATVVGCGGGTTGYAFYPNRINYPLERWVHVAFQLKGDADGISLRDFIDGEARGTNGRATPNGGWLTNPLYIGGIPPERNGNMKCGSIPTYESMRGWIDEIRISKGWRYDGDFKPTRDHRPDDDTIAYWTFDERGYATSFEDDSGNGYTLKAGGALAVEPANRLVTTWANIKQR